jgi:hypothetical protein
MKTLFAALLLAVSICSAGTWVNDAHVKIVRVQPAGSCYFKIVGSSTWYGFDATTAGGKNLLSVLLAIKSTDTVFQFYVPGNQYQTNIYEVDNITMGQDN